LIIWRRSRRRIRFKAEEKLSKSDICWNETAVKRRRETFKPFLWSSES